MAAERSFRSFSISARAYKDKASALKAHAMERVNLVDQYIFGKMELDGIAPAPLTTDEEFQRRVRLDLTGRIAKPEEVEAFLADTSPAKRDLLIEQLLSSEAFVDHFTQFYSNQYEVTSQHYNIIGITGRNAFYRFVRDFVKRERPYDEFVRDILTASGDNLVNGAANFLVRGQVLGDPIQDTWDTATDRITTRFLGHKTECISCHNGRPNLNKINLFLYSNRREDFFRQSAFLSRMVQNVVVLDPFGNAQHVYLTDRTTGGYHGSVPANNPGARPQREGGPYSPVYIFTKRGSESENWRQDLAKVLTADRQFARAAVNYLWAKLFTVGVVNPPDGWDLARIDPQKPPPEPWTLQPSHPELIEALADEFIRSGFNIKSMVRLLVKSNAYQLSSKHPDYRPETDRYFARHIPRRMLAEEVYDALAESTSTVTPMYVEGFSEPLLYAGQLPDPTEPRRDGNILNVMAQFGRGDWRTEPRNSTSTVLQALFLMNDGAIVQRAAANLAGNRNTRVAQIMQSSMDDDAAIRHLFLATLSRVPTDSEMEVVRRNKRGTRDAWLADLQWALLNKLDFLFNY